MGKKRKERKGEKNRMQTIKRVKTVIIAQKRPASRALRRSYTVIQNEKFPSEKYGNLTFLKIMNSNIS